MGIIQDTTVHIMINDKELVIEDSSASKYNLATHV